MTLDERFAIRLKGLQDKLGFRYDDAAHLYVADSSLDLRVTKWFIMTAEPAAFKEWALSAKQIIRNAARPETKAIGISANFLKVVDLEGSAAATKEERDIQLLNGALTWLDSIEGMTLETAIGRHVIKHISPKLKDAQSAINGAINDLT